MDTFVSNFKLIVPLAFSLIGLIFTVIGLILYKKAKRTSNWQATYGTILLSEIKKSTGSSFKTGTNQSNYNYSNIYTPEICYSYNVLSQEYNSNKIGVFGSLGTSSSVRAFNITKKYPVNSRVTVYYNPDNPKDSVLEQGVKSENIVFLVIGVALLVIPLIVVYFLTLHR
jgi:hypothetical protein